MVVFNGELLTITRTADMLQPFRTSGDTRVGASVRGIWRKCVTPALGSSLCSLRRQTPKYLTARSAFTSRSTGRARLIVYFKPSQRSLPRMRSPARADPPATDHISRFAMRRRSTRASVVASRQLFEDEQHFTECRTVREHLPGSRVPRSREGRDPPNAQALVEEFRQVFFRAWASRASVPVVSYWRRRDSPPWWRRRSAAPTLSGFTRFASTRRSTKRGSNAAAAQRSKTTVVRCDGRRLAEAYPAW